MNLVRLASAVLGAGLLFAGPAHGQAAATSSTGTRHYDCSKAGNANKAACKQAGPAPAVTPSAVTATTTKTATTRHYDCTKAGNANKAACKQAPAAAAPPTPAPAAAPVARRTITHSVQTSQTSTATTAPAPASAAGPNGATAQCNDGTYSHAAHHQGACSRHHGVKQFY